MLFYHKPFSFLYYKVCNAKLNKTPYTLYHFTAHKFEKNPCYVVFNEFITNPKYNEQEKKTFAELYYTACSVYKIFKKFYHNKLREKMTLYTVSCDLNFQPLSLIKDKYKFTFSQENKIYTFSINDMIRIIKNGLLNHDSYFSCPQTPKNPYTNLSLSKAILYNFYFYLQDTGILIPEYLRRYFNTGFMCKIFLRKNRFYIREQIINNTINEMTHDEIYEQIILLLRSLRVNLYIHIDYSKIDVIEKCKNIFTYHLHTNYNLSDDSKKYYQQKIDKKINHLFEERTTFGRIFINKKYNKKDYPHWNYKYHNLLDFRIPRLKSLKDIYTFMEYGNYGSHIIMNMDISDNDNVDGDDVNEYEYDYDDDIDDEEDTHV